MTNQPTAADHLSRYLNGPEAHTVRQAGWHAHGDYQPAEANPYQPGDARREAWRQGWEYADEGGGLPGARP